MRRAFPWSTLGIDADSDEAAVRRAYATKLKAMDPDADHKGFERLRAARERALALARSRAAGAVEEQEDDWYDDDEDYDHGEDASFLAPSPPDSDTEPVDDATASETADAPLIASQDALHRLLLHADPDEAMGADDQALVHQHLDVILGDPRMEEIGFGTDIENWLASIFSSATPRSHPFVQRLADHFGWRADAGTINQPHNIAWLAGRALAFDFRDRVTQPTNKGYRAWIELSTPGKKRHGTRYVRELLSTIRSKHPVLEDELDWHKVGQWGGGGSTGTGSSWGKNAGWIVIGIIGFIQIVGAIGRSGDDPIDAPSADQAQTIAVQQAEFQDPARRRVTIDDVLRKVGGSDYTADRLQRSNAELYDILDAKLLESKASHETLEDVEPVLEALLFRRIQGSVATVPYSLLVTYRRAQADVLQSLATDMPGRCSDFLRGDALSGSAALVDGADTYQRASRAMLLGGSTEAPEGDGTVRFQALQTTVEDAARRAGMTLERWQQVYSGDSGQPRDYCIVNASIIDAAIAAPREESERVLRDL